MERETGNNIQEINAAEAGGKVGDRFNDLFGILCVQTDRDGIDVPCLYPGSCGALQSDRRK